MQALNILHVFRAPVGGLFRHVTDLVREQIARGHRVGLVADSRTGGTHANRIFGELAPRLALGISRVPMWRNPGLSDLPALLHVMKRVRETDADIVHGHGAKGGAYARLAVSGKRAVRAYTPHGGSLLLNRAQLATKLYFAVERFLMRRGELFLFESAFVSEIFHRQVGTPAGIVRIVHNGALRREFEPIEQAPDATDLVFVGELREAKGVNVLIESLSMMHRNGGKPTATLVGDGPDAAVMRALAEQKGLGASVRFLRAMPARKALALGRVMVVPSLRESLPYVVLEAAAAGKPMVATRVGGIPEIFGPLSDALVPPGDAAALASAIARTLDDPEAAFIRAQNLRTRVAEGFTVECMVDGVLAAYGSAIEQMRPISGPALSIS